MEEKIQQSPQTDLVHSFNDVKSSFFTPQLLIIFIAVALLGIGSGYLISKNASNSGPVAATGSNITNSTSITKGATFGSDDTKTFSDMAQGELAEGGIEGEGQYHLVRPGGDSQNVYMTSGTVDLSKFVGKQIKVWGQTQQAQHAGWLMDVGKVEVL